MMELLIYVIMFILKCYLNAIYIPTTIETIINMIFVLLCYYYYAPVNQPAKMMANLLRVMDMIILDLLQ